MDIDRVVKQHALWLKTDGEKGLRAYLCGANFNRANLCDVNLTGANLSRANLYNVNLSGANLRDVNLTGANLNRASLCGVNLTGANMSGATLRVANLAYANLTGANLTGANLTYANLTYANLTGADLYGTRLYGTIGDSYHLKSVSCGIYPVSYTAEVMQIGCQRHGLEDWWSFDDARIKAMGGATALEWWRIWKPILQQIVAASPATATGRVS